MSSYARGIVRVDRVDPSGWIVVLYGEHDMTNSDRLGAELAEVLPQRTAVIVDLSAATFIGSSTVKELIAAQERIDALPAEPLTIVAPEGGFARRVLDLLHADRAVRVVENRDDARRFHETPASDEAAG